MEFIKTEFPTGEAFLSDCKRFKIVKYGDRIFLYKKATRDAFGDSVEKEKGKSKAYKTYNEAFEVARKN